MLIQNKQILFPVLAQVLLTIIVHTLLVIARVKAVRLARVNPQITASSAGHEKVMKGHENISDHFENLFEVPVLFFISAILIFSLQWTDTIYVVASWAFVILRYAHSFVHCTYNRIVHRFFLFMMSSFVLWAIWIRLGLQVIVK